MSALKLKEGNKVLEIGAGSGILLCYIKEIVGDKGEVIGIEINRETYEFAKENLKKTGYERKVKLVLGDGSFGLKEEAPFDRIVCSAACPKIPENWIEQLKNGGILVAPVGEIGGDQNLIFLKKLKGGKIVTKNLGPVIFVPLSGKFGFKI